MILLLQIDIDFELLTLHVTLNLNIQPRRFSIEREFETGWQRFGVALALCALCYCTAAAVADIGAIFGLTGAVCGSALVFVTPPAVAWRLEQKVRGQVSWQTTAARLSMAVLGVVLGIVGVVTQFIGDN